VLRFAYTGLSISDAFRHQINKNIARQGIHINRIDAENTNEISAGDSSCETPYGVLIRRQLYFSIDMISLTGNIFYRSAIPDGIWSI
jgi:hypothetical protein